MLTHESSPVISPVISQVSNVFFFFSGKLAYKWVCLPDFVIELAYVRSTSHSVFVKKSNEQTSK